jgi:hypothetical protein
MALLMAMVVAGGMMCGTAPASPLYTEVVKNYMEGRWEVLEKTLKEKVRELGQLSTEEQAAVATIRLAVREGRQDWWTTTKAGTKGQIMPIIWGRKISVQFDPKVKYGSDIKMKNGSMMLIAGWVGTDMDNMEKTPGGFTKGDVACLTAWSNLGIVDSWSQLPGGSQGQKDRYLEFRGKVTGMAYGTPGARRYGMWSCLSSFTEENPKSPTRMSRRAIGTMFMEEVLTHPESYPSVTLPGTLAAENAEGTLGLALATVVAKQPWTFAEDNLIRTAVKQLAAMNGVKANSTGVITLPNKLTMSLDPRADEALAAERGKWIKEQFDRAKGVGK